MRVLISGATGFIGSKLLNAFIKLPIEIAIHSNKEIETLNENVILFQGKLTDISNQIKNFAPHYVFHLAGSSKHCLELADQSVLWDSNLLYGSMLLEILKDQENLVFVNFNTSLAYDGVKLSPFNYYAMTKASFIKPLEYYSSNYKVRVFNLILYNVYGPGDKTKRAINFIMDSLGSIHPVGMSPGAQLLDFIHVDDVIKLSERLLEESPNFSIEDIHVGTGIGTSLKSAAILLEKLTHLKANINFGELSYRKEEKMINVAPVEKNRFWKSTIIFEKGILTLL